MWVCVSWYQDKKPRTYTPDKNPPDKTPPRQKPSGQKPLRTNFVNDKTFLT